MPEFTIQQAIDLGKTHLEAKQLPQAESIFRQVLAAQPGNAEALHLLGLVEFRNQHYKDAIDLLRRATAINPAAEQYHFNLGLILSESKQYDKAIPAFQTAIALLPDFPEAYHFLGLAHRRAGDIDAAIAAHDRAIALRPDYLQAYNGLAIAYRDLNKLDQAVAAYERGLAIGPNDATLHYGLSMMLLAQGDFQRGWAEFEWRRQAREFMSTRLNLPQPRWNGEPLEGKRIFLHAEQGFGDTIQFSRFAPILAKRGATVTMACYRELAPLLRSLDGVEQVLNEGQTVPPFDTHCPLPSLPVAMGLTLDTVPSQVPYLYAEAARVQRWRSRVEQVQGKLKVGLAWAGRREPDPNRSIPIQALEPLASIPGLAFFSLQKQPERSSPSFPMTDSTSQLEDFADTAALMSCLDLVISIDTAAAHLAGALAKPVLLLLPFAADWRWLLDRSDSPWYPTMRIFRQAKIGDWESPVNRAREALLQMTKH